MPRPPRAAWQEEHCTRLFEEPDNARAVLRDAVLRDAEGGGEGRITGTLLDNATVDHAFRYFTQAAWGLDRDPILPTRGRLLLLAVAEFVNALILYERIETGPEETGHWYGDAALNAARQLVTPASDRLPWPELFAVLRVAELTGTQLAADDPGQRRAGPCSAGPSGRPRCWKSHWRRASPRPPSGSGRTTRTPTRPLWTDGGTGWSVPSPNYPRTG
ncbi:MAG TPA: hypothetical protein VFE14_12610 [Micromonosporaceae bacterium]|nr:hypothetical protein [Micromonosporaceae bacterium]